jgi:hypothetical protein
MTTPARVDLLHALCALLPEHDARLIHMMPVDDALTYVEAYAAARRSGTRLPSELRRDFVNTLIQYIEDDFRSAQETASA